MKDDPLAQPADAPLKFIHSPHLLHLDGLRAVLALYVVLHHCYLEIFRIPSVESSAKLPRVFHFFEFGNLAVLSFIGLSGFCLALPAVRHGMQLRGGALRFFYARARRILPTFYYALVLSYCAALSLLRRPTGTIWDVSIPVGWKAVLANVLLVQDAWQVSKINYVFWSIAVEWRIYFILPALLGLWRRFGVLPTSIVGSIGLLGLSVVVNGSTEQAWLSKTLEFTATFIFGAGAAWIAHGIDAPKYLRSRTLLYGCAIIALGVMAGVGRAKFIPSANRPPLAEAAFGFAFAALLASWSLSPKDPFRRCLSVRPLPAIGVFAYSIYLTHAPIVHATYLILHGSAPISSPARAITVLMFTATALVLAMSFLFFLLCERPFLSSRQVQAAKMELSTLTA